MKDSCLILEKSVKPLESNMVVDRTAKTYKLRGVCADFNGENDNGRFYTEEDYLPHLEYLQEEIKANSLLGECDHGEEYMVSMKEISHIITDLYYDKEKRQVIIEIELLDTERGRDMMALVDKGVPLHISSRASGYIDEAGSVSLEKIYTYDIVYQPGFKNARLTLVNESLNIRSKNIQIFKITESQLATFNKTNTMAEKKDTPTFITQADFNDYTKQMSKNIDSLRTLMIQNQRATKDAVGRLNEHITTAKNNRTNKRVKINESITKVEEFGIGDEKLATLKDPLQEGSILNINGIDYKIDSVSDADGIEIPEITETLRFKFELSNGEEKKVVYADMGGVLYMEEPDTEAAANTATPAAQPNTNEGAEQDPNVMTIQEVTTYLTQFQAAFNELGEVVKRNSADIEGMVNHSEMTKQVLESMISNMDDCINYVNTLGDNHDAMVETVNAIADNQAEMNGNIEESVKYSNLLSKFVNTLADVQDALPAANIPVVDTNATEANESKKRGIQLPSKNIGQEVKNLIEQVKEQKTEHSQIILEAKYPIVKFLTPEHKSKFSDLSEAFKRSFCEEVASKTNVSKEDIDSIFENLGKQAKVSDQYLRMMPKHLIPVWESLNSQEKKSVINLFCLRNPATNMEVEQMWETIDLGKPGSTTYLNPVNESLLEPTDDNDGLPYDDSEIDRKLGLV